MNDPLDDLIADALHGEPTPSPDPAAAHAEFLVRRRRRQQRLVAGAAVAAVVALTGGALALANNHHKGTTEPVAANGRTAQPQPGPEETGLAPPSSTTPTSSPIPGPTSSTTVRGSAPTSQPALPSTTVAHSTPSSGPPAVGPGPPGPAPAVVTEADNGKSYTLHRGDTLEVRLSGGTYHWSTPMSSNEAVLRRTAVAAGTADGGAWASFVAQADGQADVTSTGDPPCRQSTPPCMAPSQLFQVSFRVSN